MPTCPTCIIEKGGRFFQQERSAIVKDSRPAVEKMRILKAYPDFRGVVFGLGRAKGPGIFQGSGVDLEAQRPLELHLEEDHVRLSRRCGISDRLHLALHLFNSTVDWLQLKNLMKRVHWQARGGGSGVARGYTKTTGG